MSDPPGWVLTMVVAAALALSGVGAVRLVIPAKPIGQAPEASPGASTSSAVPIPAVASRQPERGEAVVALHPPPDVDEAREVAGRFALALFRDDLEELRRLATTAYGEHLLRPSATGEGSSFPPATPPPTTAAPDAPSPGAVRLEGMTTEDMQPDAVHVQVVVGRSAATLDGGTREALELVAVVVVRTDAGWRVREAAS